MYNFWPSPQKDDVNVELPFTTYQQLKAQIRILYILLVLLYILLIIILGLSAAILFILRTSTSSTQINDVLELLNKLVAASSSVQ